MHSEAMKWPLTLFHETVVERLDQIVLEAARVELHQLVLVVNHKLRVASLPTTHHVVIHEACAWVLAGLHIWILCLLHLAWLCIPKFFLKGSLSLVFWLAFVCLWYSLHMCILLLNSLFINIIPIIFIILIIFP